MKQTCKKCKYSKYGNTCGDKPYWMTEFMYYSVFVLFCTHPKFDRYELKTPDVRNNCKCFEEKEPRIKESISFKVFSESIKCCKNCEYMGHKSGGDYKCFKYDKIVKDVDVEKLNDCKFFSSLYLEKEVNFIED